MVPDAPVISVAHSTPGPPGPPVPPPPYVLRRRGGANLTHQPPLFSPDQSLLFVISGCNILIYDVASAEYVKSLKSDENSSPIVAMAFPVDDERSLVTCDKSGKMITWKWHASVQISEKTIKLPDNSYVQTFHLLNNEEAVVSWCTIQDVQIGVINLSSGEIIRQPAFSNLKIGFRWSLALGYCDNIPVVAFSTGSPKVHMFDAINTQRRITHRISNMEVTTLAWHPTSELLAVGDSMGRINLCRIPFNKSIPSKELLHWHHLPLTSVVFSPRGGLMLTGGSERVLVAWGANNFKKFIPRLPAPILHIAAGNTHIAITTADNGIQIVESSSLRVTGCIREAGGLGGVKYQNDKVVKSAALQYIRSAAALLLPAVSGHLHLYSTVSNTLMYTMDVTNANIVHPEKDNLYPEQIEVTEVSVGCRGQWLVTWEGVNEQERIRWWDWSGHDWKLHTVVARSHRPALPVALNLASDTPVTLSADQQNNIRFWRIMDTVPGYEGKSAWYTNAKVCGIGGEAGGATLSGDGSVAAAWFGARLTLWDTLEGKQKASLAHPALRPQGKLVEFGRGHHMHYIACTTDSCLAVWNTMTLRLLWMVKLNTSCLISDPFSDKVVAVTSTNDVFLFRMHESKPLLTLEGILPPEQGAITSITFAPAESLTDDFRLYLLREQQEIFVIERSEPLSNVEPSLERIGETTKTIPSAYSAMIAENKSDLVSVHHNSYQPRSSTKVIINELLLSSASHAQPRLSNLCGPVLRALVGSQKPTEKNSTSNLTEVKVEITSISDITVTNSKKTKKKKLLKESMNWAKSLMCDDV